MNPTPQIRTKVFDQEQYNGDWPPESLDGFREWLDEKIDEIPEQFRASARIEIDSTRGYEDSHYAHIEIHYTRPMTAQEIEDAANRQKEQDARQEQRERETYQRLSHKYGPAS